MCPDTDKTGRHELLDELGNGTCGVVYRARELHSGRLVALKQIRPEPDLSPDDKLAFFQRFHQAVLTAGHLSHPNIITIHEIHEDLEEKTCFISMELIDGVSIQQQLDDGRIFSLSEAIGIIRQAAEGLLHAHQHKVTHGGIKPTNLILKGDGKVVVTDFGTAAIGPPGLSGAGQFTGDASFVAPEQIIQGKIHTGSDIFALASVFYLLLTRERPFTGDQLSTIFFKVVEREPLPPSQLNPEITPDIDLVVARGMAKNKADRYQDMSRFIEDLDSLLNGEIPRWAFSELTGESAVGERLEAEGSGHTSIVVDGIEAMVVDGEVTIDARELEAGKLEGEPTVKIHPAESAPRLKDFGWKERFQTLQHSLALGSRMRLMTDALRQWNLAGGIAAVLVPVMLVILFLLIPTLVSTPGGSPETARITDQPAKLLENPLASPMILQGRRAPGQDPDAGLTDSALFELETLAAADLSWHAFVGELAAEEEAARQAQEAARRRLLAQSRALESDPSEQEVMTAGMASLGPAEPEPEMAAAAVTTVETIEQHGLVDIRLRHALKTGTLRLIADGREIFSSPLSEEAEDGADETGAFSTLKRKLKKSELVIPDISVPVGSYTLKVVLESGDTALEPAILETAFDPDQKRHLSVSCKRLRPKKVAAQWDSVE